MSKSPWKRITLWTIALVILALVVSDIFLRVAFGLGDPLLYNNDPDTGYIVAPSQHVVRVQCHNDINAFSMRSPEVISPKPPGEFRLLMIGDSITYGTTYVDQSEIFTTLLNRQLPARLGKKVEVLNASAGGWGPANELGYLRSRGAFQADLVTFVLNTGDLVQDFAISNVGRSPEFPSRDPPCALAELWNHYLLPRIRHEVFADPGSRPVAADPVRQTPPNLAILAQARQITSAAGAPFTIMYIPSQGPDWAAYAPGLIMLRNWCKAQSVDLIDLTSEFSKVPATELCFDNGHGHLRPAAHKIVARLFADYLATGKYLHSNYPATRFTVSK